MKKLDNSLAEKQRTGPGITLPQSSGKAAYSRRSKGAAEMSKVTNYDDHQPTKSKDVDRLK